jgi:hypothetical protein
MHPSGKCLCRIALAAANVIDFGCKTQNTTKKPCLATDYHTFLLTNQVTFETQHEPSTQHIEATSYVKMWDVAIGAEEHVYISSYQMLPADKNLKSYLPWTKLVKIAGTYAVIAVILLKICVLFLKQLFSITCHLPMIALNMYQIGHRKNF